VLDLTRGFAWHCPLDDFCASCLPNPVLKRTLGGPL
jgi:hypothetical protein